MDYRKQPVERLVEEGILDADKLSEEHIKIINEKLTEEEVQALASIRQKLSFFHWPIKPMMF